jgi:hypothetical protein
MSARKFVAALGAVQLFILLAACGELSAPLPSSGTYRVDAMADAISLADCAITGTETQIRPYFISSIGSDPDVRGLIVFLQSPGGKAVSGKLHYTLDAVDEGFSTPAPDTPALFPETEAPAASFPEDPEPALEAVPAEDPGFGEPPADPGPEAVSPGEQVPAEQIPAELVPVEAPPGEQAPAEEPPALAEAPFEGLPPPGPPPGEQPPVEPWRADPPALKPPARGRAKNLVRMDGADHLIAVSRLDMDLPPFSLPADLEIGRYVMVFQVRGEREILDRIDKTVYFTGDARLSIDDVKSYLPGFSGGSPLIPPGAVIMLEAQISADPRLDPYVVWYNGRKRIAEGLVSEGANRFMWKAPEQTGFHNIRAELFPLRPALYSGGKVKELSLPVSQKQERAGYFAGAQDGFAYWYQFRGDLLDSKTADTGRALILPHRNAHPHWLPAAGIYGIAVGRDDVYLLPGSPFSFSENEQVSGEFMLRFKPLGEGTVFRASFRTGTSPRDALVLTLAYTGKVLKLILTADSESVVEDISSGIFSKNEFVAAVIDFSIRGEVFTAGLRLENTDILITDKSLTLPEPLTRAGPVQFGAPLPREALPRRETTAEETGDLSPADPAPPIAAILDEAAFAYRVEPLAAEESPPPPTPPRRGADREWGARAGRT